MRIAYLINQYPRISHSFIRREIMRVAIRGWDAELTDESDQKERERTRYALRDGMRPLLAAGLRVLLTRPRRLFRALGIALRRSRYSDRPFYVHLVYVAEACL